AGISAFKGKNITHGALGSFIQAVKDGVIEKDSTIFIENLDRLTRSGVGTAQKLLLDLLDLGLTVVTGMDQRVYTMESANENPTDMLISLLMFSRANEESKTKQNRTNNTARALVARFKQGQPTNIKNMSNDPWWFDSSGSKYEAVKPHPVHWVAAQKAVELFLMGWGCFRVTAYLNSHLDLYPAPKPTKRQIDQGVKKWAVPNLVTMRKNPALMGVKKLTIEGYEHKLDGYYPALVTPEQFARIQDIRTGNKFVQGEQKKMISLLSGLGVLKCGLCGGPMIAYSREGRLRYVCSNGKIQKSSCKVWSVNGSIVENLTARALVYGYTHSILLGNTKTEDLTPLIESKETELGLVKKQLTNQAQAISTIGPIQELIEQVAVLSQREQSLLLELDSLKQKLALQGSENKLDELIIKTLSLFSDELLGDVTHTDRMQIREVVRKCLPEITISKLKDKALRIDFRFHDYSHMTFQGVMQGKEKSYTLTRTPHDQLYTKIAAVFSDVLETSLDATDIDGYMAASDRMVAALGLPEPLGRDFFSKR
ncbi:TPA: recombinase zinc beta ribbon domain-containing protein, partial [Citrobacter freundii]|nr:recombinase zinc beta ribbon domain-containing protein [Citrobacter freundii]HBB4768840.1 recombinase zinc beta ribbon domain-containing protein [Citrobacter freundii]